MNAYSVVIIGGGPAGSSCAIALAKLGIRDVLMIEASNYSKFVIGESIPPHAKKVLNSLGVFKDFLKENHLPCYGVCSYWGDDKRGYNDTVLSPFGHGWHLDRAKFNLFLAQQAKHKGTTLKTKAVFKEGILLDNENYSIRYTQHDKVHEVTTKYVVDASGSQSVFAKQQGSRAIQGTSLICLGRRFKIKNADKISSLTRIEAVENGWWYGAKLPNNEMLIAFYTDQETVKQTKMHHKSYWMQALRKTKSISLGVEETLAIDKNSKGFLVPSFCLDQIAGNNWIAIGDAASAYDPITSRGIYKSLTDGNYAATCIANTLKTKSESIANFEVYCRQNYCNYLEERAHYYNSEQRWSTNSFWLNIQQTVSFDKENLGLTQLNTAYR